jgi:hypothetical protein
MRYKNMALLFYYDKEITNMLKKRIKYEDFNGDEREEDFYFNLNKSELLKWDLSTAGGLETLIKKIIDTKDIAKLLEIFEEIIDKAYGERSADGKQFIKSKELVEAFKQTNAYDNMFMEFMQNPDEYAKFIKAIIPSDIAKELKETN